MTVSLGALLELLHNAHDNVASGCITYRDYREPPGHGAIAVERQPGLQLRWQADNPWSGSSELTRIITFERRDYIHVEIQRDSTPIRTASRVGAKWRRWDELDGHTHGHVAVTNTVPRVLTPVVLEPFRLLSRLRLETAGVGRRANRDVVMAQGYPREAGPDGKWTLHHLEFDVQHGTLLHHAAFLDEKCFHVTEAMRVEYDCPVIREAL